jgi:hypothetical protein
LTPDSLPLAFCARTGCEIYQQTKHVRSVVLLEDTSIRLWDEANSQGTSQRNSV